MSVCLSTHMEQLGSHTGWIVMKIDIWVFLRESVIKKIQVVLKSDKSNEAIYIKANIHSQ